jgi:hypothetical protein
MGAIRSGWWRGLTRAGVAAAIVGAAAFGTAGPTPTAAAPGVKASVGSAAIVEGNTGAARTVEVRVTLSRPAVGAVTVRASLTPGTATPGSGSPADYKPWPKPKTVRFSPGQTVKSVTVTTFADISAEASETAIVTLTDPTGGATLGTPVGRVTIVDDDTTPSSGLRVSVGDAAIAEGDAGPTRAVPVRVTLSSPAPARVTVAVSLVPGTAVGGARSPADYKSWAKPKQLTFLAGQTAKRVAIVVLPDEYYEVDQTATVWLSSPSSGLAVARAVGTVTIAGDDEPTSPSSTGPVVSAACDLSLTLTNRGPISDPALIETSGITAGIRNPNVYWVHNDSGDSARVFAINADGVTQRVYTLAGAGAEDWEEIAVGAGPVAGVPYLYAADIGDNGWSRSEVAVYRVPEPAVTAGAATTLTGVDKLRLRYPDGPRDAEALIADPVTGELVIIAKDQGGPVGVYQAPGGLAAGSLTTLARVGTFTLPKGLMQQVTAAAISHDGRQIAVRTYGQVLLWGRGTGTIWDALATPACPGPVPDEGQGEAIGFDADGLGYITVSEGYRPVLHQYRAP